MYGLIRIGAAVPRTTVCDCISNQEEILRLLAEAKKKNVQVLVFPELCVTGYTCGDLFFQQSLLNTAERTVKELVKSSFGSDLLFAVGVPVRCNNQLFNCAALIQNGSLLGLVPKTYVPNYGEFYEERWFSSASDLTIKETVYCGQRVPIGNDLIFTDIKNPAVKVAVEICEDLWAPIPPSSFLTLGGATILLNLSASNELVSKAEYRKALLCTQASRSLCAYAYASAGVGESTQDALFGGHSMICERSAVLAEQQPFQRDPSLIIADADMELLIIERRKQTSYMAQAKETLPPLREIPIHLPEQKLDQLLRKINPYPFVPANDAQLSQRCHTIFQIQANALAKRMEHTHAESMVIGISGGLDSTLALLVAVEACRILGLDRKTILGVTMPGFGTSDRTYHNALSFMEALGIRQKEISIVPSVLQHFSDIGHDPKRHNVTYENAQARERTQILMDFANMENGLVIGTGDLSELALGWATYNGDHMSMYGVNAGVPKTLVKVLVKWVAETGNIPETAKAILLDILDTPISPELLPPDQEGNIDQKTEDLVGPYQLHDFFLYYVVRFGFTPAKIYYLAQQAFGQQYDKDTLKHWLHHFYRRFFSQQFKRSCLPDGPKVGTISLSPRSDWRMPTDASVRLWLEELEKL